MDTTQLAHVKFTSHEFNSRQVSDVGDLWKNIHTGGFRVGVVSFVRILLIVVAFQVSFLDIAYSQDEGHSKPYVRRSIDEARFGTHDWRRFVESIYKMDQHEEFDIVGQKNTIRALQTRLLSYLENFDTMTGEPAAFHMIGPPGVGKTAIVEMVEKIGFRTIRFDAQQFAKKNTSFAEALIDAVDEVQEEDEIEPVVIIIEELDKLAEIFKDGEGSTEFIGTLNQILSEGKISDGHVSTEFSQYFILTTQNIRPETFTAFNKQALKKDLNFFEMTNQDFKQFYDWVLKQKGALAKTLATVFRTNTVGRLLPNAYLMEPLTEFDFLMLTEKALKDAIETSTKGLKENQLLDVTFDESIKKYLNKITMLPASGARNTIMRTTHLTMQLVSFARRASVPGVNSLDRPRKILLSYNPKSDSVVVSVTPQKRVGRQLVDEKSFSIRTRYDSANGSFNIPKEVKDYVAPPPPQSEEISMRVFGREIVAARFPESSGIAPIIAKKLQQKIFGQEELIDSLSRDLDQYMSRQGPSTTQPSNIILAGFPGTGKSITVTEAANALELPLIRVNLQNFASDDSTTSGMFIDSITREIYSARQKREDGKFILLLEELDKVYELDPQTGQLVPRPIMALIKDLLSNGKAEALGGSDFYSTMRKLDVSGGFVAVTMNFAVDLFGFEADPRLTTIDDVVNAWEHLSTRLQDLKGILGQMFLPETVNRLLPKTIIVKPLTEPAYRKIIQRQLPAVIAERFVDEKGRNIGQIELVLTPEYKKYLYSESVIPSEGGRYAETKSKQIISQDFEEAISSLPKGHPYGNKPLVVQLHYRPASQTVVATATLKDNKEVEARELYAKPVSLNFPPLNAKGKLDPSRLHVSIHEFGHAFAALRIGYRFSYATVVSPKSGTGGYVKPSAHPESGLALSDDIYVTLASRAMERIFLTDNPLSDESVMDITPGASSDIEMATSTLYTMLYELGYNPYGQTISRASGKGYGTQSFNDLSQEELQKLGIILREMEDYLVQDFLKAHPKDWYAQKVVEFARVGGLQEAAFYKMVGYAFPGENNTFMGDFLKLFETFKDVIEPQEKAVVKAQNSVASLDGLTQMERAQKFKNYFISLLKKHYKDSFVNKSGSVAPKISCKEIL